MASTCSDEAVLAGLFLAAYDGKVADVKSLLKINALSADVSDPIKGSTVLQWACTGGSLEVVEWLVKEGGAKVGHRNKDERTAFFFACEHCHKPVAEFLVRQAGVDVNAKDGPSGHSPLHRACIAGQTREKAGAMDLIAWLLTSAKANAEATDLGGRKPGEADLAKEASALKPTAIAAKISGALTDARTGKTRGATSAKPTPPAIATPAVGLSPTPAASRSGRPTTTLAAARAAAAAKSSSSPRADSPAASPAKTGSHFAVPPPVKNAFSPAKTASPARIPSPQSPRGPASPGRSSPSRVAARAAALAEKTGAVSTAGPSSASAPVPTSPSAAMAAMALDPNSSAPVSSVTIGTAPPHAQPSPPSPQRAAERATSPRSAEASQAPWSTKPRAGGVHPRAGGGLPVTASSAQPGSPAAVTAAAAAAVTSATTAPAPAAGAGAAARPSIAKDRLRPVSGSHAAPAPASTTAVDPSSAPASRYQRPGATSTGTAAAGTGSATGSAAAVIGASHGPKASALAAAFENKARERDTTTAPAARPIRRGNSGLSNSSATAANTPPALSSTWGGAANGGGGGGGGGGRPTTKVPPKRTTPPQVPHVSATAPRVTPESILGKGSVMHRKQVYVAAAQKGGNAPASPKAKAAPFLGKDNKPKDGSFMDKFVSMFSISPQSSPANSPPRSSSRSPRAKQRTPSSVNGSDKSCGSPKPSAEPARMGFFNTNLSFKMPNATEKE